MSDLTKRALEQSLKNLLLQKPLHKITISDIADDCGINRMTFYYHFKDIYDLVEWSCQEDAAKALAGKKTYETWQQGFEQIFEAVLANKPFIMNVYHSVSREQVETYLYKLTYDLNTSGDYEVFPLQLGDGSYTVELFENVSGKKYSAEGKVSVNVKLDDPYAPFLGPNQYVNYTPDTEAVQTSYELCAGMTDPQEIFETVQAYIKANYLYDYVKAETVKSGTLPDIDGCYESKMGICQDLAAMAACMLRVQGIPTRLMIGYAGKMYHAWNTVIINGEEVLYDPTLELSAIDSGLTYTVERYY